MWDNKNQIRQEQLEFKFYIYNMCSNVLPSAPHEEPGMYPQLPPVDFRMQKTNEVSAALNAEVSIIAVLRKNISGPRKPQIGSLPVQACFQLHVQLQASDLLLLLWAFLLQFHLAELVVYSLLLPQG